MLILTKIAPSIINPDFNPIPAIRAPVDACERVKREAQTDEDQTPDADAHAALCRGIPEVKNA